MWYCHTASLYFYLSYCFVAAAVALVILVRFMVASEACTCCRPTVPPEPEVRVMRSNSPSPSPRDRDRSYSLRPRSSTVEFMSSFFRNGAIGVMVLAFLAIFFVAISWLLGCMFGLYTALDLAFTGLFALCYIVAAVLMLFIFFRRLRDTFQNTSYAFSNYVFIGIKTMLVLGCLLGFFVIVNIALNDEELNKLRPIAILSTIGVFFTCQIIIIGLFVRSLFKLASAMIDSYGHRFEKLVSVAIRFSILVVVSSLKSLFVPAVFVFVFGVTESVAMSTDIILTQVFLWMQFSFGEKLYRPVFGRLHDRIANKIIAVKKQHLEKRSVRSVESKDIEITGGSEL